MLLTLLYIVSIAGAAWGGWYFANKMMKERVSEATFHRLTFRRGEVRTARFAPDGDTLVYSASWDGNPSEIFVANRRSPEARPLGVNDADLLAIAKSTELGSYYTVAVDPARPATIYAASGSEMGDGPRILRSTDSGRTWAIGG